MSETLPHESMDPRQRVVITGHHAVTPIGDGQEFVDRMFAGDDGISHLPEEWLTEYPKLGVYVGAQIEDFDITNSPIVMANPKALKLSRLHRATQFAFKAGSAAAENAGLISETDYRLGMNGQVDPNRVGVIMGTGIGGAGLLGDLQETLKLVGKLRTNDILAVLPERPASVLSMRLNARGPVHGVTAACATGLKSIINGADIIRTGRADVVIAGGTDAQITPLGLALFAAIKALDSEKNPALASRPFHVAEAGFVMGEGAGALVLESLEHAKRRGAPILAELIGYDETSDADDDTAPSGEGAVRVLNLALGRALGDVSLKGIVDSYYNTHTTATRGDKVELESLIRAEYVSLENIAGISSSKGAVGHMLGAAGAVESIVCIETLRQLMLPPTLKLGNNLENMIEIARQMPITHSKSTPFLNNGRPKIAVNDSFGFGGLDAAAVFAQYIG
jgi:3-oxoacyl-[acyl-carrier-protein] synthase II